MNRNVLVGIIVLVILLFGGSVYYLGTRINTQPATPQTVSDPTQQSVMVDESTQQSIKELFDLGIAQTCTFDVSDESYQSSGTVYVDNGRMRGDFVTSVDGTLQNSHMIVMDGISYVWVDGQAQGFKMTFGEDLRAKAEEAAENYRGLDVNDRVNYNCTPGIVTGSQFDLPDGVEFVSIDEMMQGLLGPTGSQGNASQCAACNSLSGDAKTQCLTALNCN